MAVITGLSKLPKTQHDPLSFTVDVTLFTVSLSVSIIYCMMILLCSVHVPSGRCDDCWRNEKLIEHEWILWCSHHYVTLDHLNTCFPSLFSAVLNTWGTLKMTRCTESHSILGFLAVDNLREVLNKSCRLSLPPPSLPPSLPPFLPSCPPAFLTSLPPFLSFPPSSFLPSFNLFHPLSPYNLISSMNYKGILGIILILMNFWTIEWLCYEFVTLIGKVQNVPRKSQMQISLLTLKQCWTNNCTLMLFRPCIIV